MIGQETIYQELMNINSPANILIYGRSGYGKTTLAELLIHNLENKGLTSKRYSIGQREFFPYYDIHFFDEAHTLKSYEFLYPYMDMGKYYIIFTTNITGTLPEPLRNRCRAYYLKDYTFSSIAKILEKRFNLSEEISKYLASFSRNNPRIAIVLVERIISILNEKELTKNKIKSIMQNLGVFKGGYTELDYRYLQALRNAGGEASLNTLSVLTGIDREEILNYIEPFLMRKNRIKILHRRILVK